MKTGDGIREGLQVDSKTYRVLITGANSYIGTSFENWIKDYCPDVITKTIDLRDDSWCEESFCGYDTVFHVAGIAHADVGGATEEQKNLYYQVNTGLAARCAEKAKADGVGQFIFMSSMIVYGESAGIGKNRMITRDTAVSPANFYGDSKRKAEEKLLELESGSFRVVILRPPMIYGRGSKGNYPVLAKMAARLPVFPKIDNQRSMLYVGNLCRFVYLMVRNQERGIFFPQNSEYVCTSDMVREIAAVRGRKIILLRGFNPFLRLTGHLGGRIGGLANKAFGNMTYDKAMSDYKEEYRMFDFRESIRLTERRQAEAQPHNERK